MVVRPAAAARATSSAGVSRPSDAVVWRWRSITERRARAWRDDAAACVPGSRRWLRLALALAPRQRAVLANQHLEMVALFLGELEEDLLAFGVLEALAVALEEAMRAALAANADLVRLEIVDAVAQQLVGAAREQAVRRALEEQERRTRFELRILLEQLLVALSRASPR